LETLLQVLSLELVTWHIVVAKELRDLCYSDISGCNAQRFHAAQAADKRGW
jgi:hypothetical protein